MSWAFVITALVIVATPGTGALFTIAEGLSRGTRAGVIAAVACTVGIVPHLGAAITGLAALLHASALAFQAVKVAGVLYLLFLAVQTWRDRSTLSTAPDAAATADPSVRRVMIRGVVINLLNPKLTLFFFAFLPQFVTPGSSGLAQMLGLSAVFMGMTLVVFAAYGALAAAMRKFVLDRPRVIRRMRQSFAICFVAMGAKLALTDR